MGDPSLPITPTQSTETTKLNRPVTLKYFKNYVSFNRKKYICKLTYDVTRQYMTVIQG